MSATRTSSSSGKKEHLDNSANNSVWHEMTLYNSQHEDCMVSSHNTNNGQMLQYIDRDEAPHPEVTQYMLSSRMPSMSNFETPLLPDSPQSRHMPTHSSSHTPNQNYISSPLNPKSPISSLAFPQTNLHYQLQSCQSMQFNCMASEDSQVLTASNITSLPSGQHGSMILYCLATEGDHGLLVLPRPLPNRNSVSGRCSCLTAHNYNSAPSISEAMDNVSESQLAHNLEISCTRLCKYQPKFNSECNLHAPCKQGLIIGPKRYIKVKVRPPPSIEDCQSAH
jgi:hypothetical protein